MGIGAGVLAAMVLAPAAASGACGAGNIVRDWGLHIEWAVERDANHPERPARLVEVPWDPVAVEGRSQMACVAASRGAGRGGPPSAPEVRIGMWVTAWRRDESGEIHLRGTAMGTARTGEKVSLTAGPRGATLGGIVRGPGLVELTPQKVGE
jgi:hypothetical protein